MFQIADLLFLVQRHVYFVIESTEIVEVSPGTLVFECKESLSYHNSVTITCHNDVYSKFNASIERPGGI